MPGNKKKDNNNKNKNKTLWLYDFKTLWLNEEKRYRELKESIRMMNSQRRNTEKK